MNSLRYSPVLSVTLRGYQKAAIKECLAHLRAGKSTLLVAPTGSGKTVIAAEIAKQFGRVIVVAHRKELIDHARGTFGLHVMARSIQSLAQPKGQRLKRPDLIVVDEAHRAPGRTYCDFRARYPDAVVLGLTATAWRLDGRGLGSVFSELVLAPGVAELVEAGDLVPCRTFAAKDEDLQRLDDIKKTAGDYNQKDLAELMNTPRLVGGVIAEYLKHGKGRKAVCFAVGVTHSKTLVDAFQAARVRAVHLDGRSPAPVREAALKDLNDGKYDVLCNVNLFTEGWDCPAVDCVIMARPTASLTLYLQCVGRGMRTFPGKPDLLFLDHGGNYDRHGDPEMPREWSLKDRKQLGREGREIERLRALGFDSIEAELEEKRRREGEAVSAFEVASMFGIRRTSVAAFLKRRNVSVIGKRGRISAGQFCSLAQSYKRSDVERVLSGLGETYSPIQVKEMLGIVGVRSITKSLGIRMLGSMSGARYSKEDVDLELERRRLFYSPKEAQQILNTSAEISAFAKRHNIVCNRDRGRFMYLKADVDRVAAARNAATEPSPNPAPSSGRAKVS